MAEDARALRLYLQALGGCSVRGGHSRGANLLSDCRRVSGPRTVRRLCAHSWSTPNARSCDAPAQGMTTGRTARRIRRLGARSTHHWP